MATSARWRSKASGPCAIPWPTRSVRRRPGRPWRTPWTAESEISRKQDRRTTMNRVFFRNAMVWDGSGANSFPADVLVEGNRIKTVARHVGQLSADGATVIDCRSLTLMPGLVEGHAHISFGGAVNDSDLGNIPPEEHVLLTMRNAKT